MVFKVGDKVVLTNVPNWYGGQLKQNEECVITAIECSSAHLDYIIWVRNIKGTSAAIYTSWVSKIIPKHQQLLFEFMELNL